MENWAELTERLKDVFARGPGSARRTRPGRRVDLAAAPGQPRATVHRIMRSDERWMKLVQQLKSRGKHVCVVVAAMANRFVRWLHHQLLPEPLTI